MLLASQKDLIVALQCTSLLEILLSYRRMYVEIVLNTVNVYSEVLRVFIDSHSHILHGTIKENLTAFFFRCRGIVSPFMSSRLVGKGGSWWEEGRGESGERGRKSWRGWGGPPHSGSLWDLEKGSGGLRPPWWLWKKWLIQVPLWGLLKSPDIVLDLCWSAISPLKK